MDTIKHMQIIVNKFQFSSLGIKFHSMSINSATHGKSQKIKKKRLSKKFKNVVDSLC